MQLVGELQKQQNNSQFCDTLLQTEGISVPAHSCVLAALSPYLSWKLSSSPSPPSGQKYQLQLQAVKAQTLLKLVGLLYSGEMEVKGSVEQNDVLALARQFEITDLKEGGIWRAEPQERRRKIPESERQNGFQAEKEKRRDESRITKDAQVQADMAERKDTDAPAEKRTTTSTGTQTVIAVERSLVRFIDCSTQVAPPTPEPGAQSLDLPVMLQPQSITQVKQLSSMSCPVIPSMHSGVPSEGNSPLSNPCRILTNSTSTQALSRDMLTFGLSLDDDSNSQRHQEDNTVQQSSEFEESIQVLADYGTNPENGKRDGETADSKRDTEQPSQVNRDETPEKERAKSSDKRHVCVGMKSLAKMKQLQETTETTQISAKVKLRRKNTGEMWEVVRGQDTGDTLSSFTSLKQDKTPNTDVLHVPPPPSTVQPSSDQKPDSLFLQPATTNSPKSPPHPNTLSDSQEPSNNCFTPNQNDGIEASPLLQGQGSVEESDEQIEKLLEDIMMGLNILPNLERDCSGAHHGQQSQGGGSSVCHIPVAHKEARHSHMQAGVSTAGCVFYQDLGTPNCSTDTGILCCFTAQNLPSCSALSSVLPDSALIQQQQQDFSSQYHSSVRSMWQRDGMNHQRTPLSKTRESVCPAASTARSLIPSAFFSAGQKINYSAFQEPASRPNLHKFDSFPLANGNEPQSIHSLPLPCMADFRLPRCLSPLEPCTSSANYQRVLNNSMNIGNKFQQQPSLQRRPWLAENPVSLQLPLSTITPRKNESASLPQDINGRCWSKLRQEHVELKQPNGGTWTGSCTGKEVATRKTASADQSNPLELKHKPRKMKELNTTGVKVARKRKTRKSTSHQQDAAGSILTYKDVKISDATKSKINLSICQVSLSSNNVLAKEREKAAGTLSSPSKFVRKPNQSLVTESLRKNRRQPGLSAYRTPIKTRGFVKIIQESLSETSPENVVAAQSVAQGVVNKQEVVRRKRGRPKKTPPALTAPNNIPAVDKEDSHNEGSHQQTVSLPKDDLEKGDKTKQRCKKRRRNRSKEAGEVPLKKSIEIDCHPEGDITDINPDMRVPGVNKRPRMVILKEFQKLIKSQTLKMRKSKENKQTNKPERVAESDGVATLDSTCKKPTEVFVKDVEIVKPQDRRKREGSQAVVTIDTNHNQVFNESTEEKSNSQREESGSSTSKETSVICGEKLPAFSFAALEEVSKLSADREPPLKNPDEGASNTTQQTAVQDEEGSPPSDLPQKDKPSDDCLLSQTPEKTGPGLSDAGGISRTPDCEEEEDEEEVDVLLYSPVKLQSREDGLHNIQIIPDEEEEEDVDEIDVTGDEEE
ncbi:uncharacterized protein LOC133954170 [Platichthys flesus]|uniref:uncharacterized protein LOC133954170 n=1 Tax=Platichthys flesus TaxID=8260 RepID=UPI002DBC42AC|nr:uncharacterized protein LOC133954170 [Platichthys flesus]